MSTWTIPLEAHLSLVVTRRPTGFTVALHLFGLHYKTVDEPDRVAELLEGFRHRMPEDLRRLVATRSCAS